MHQSYQKPEVLALSRLKSNGVLEFVSRKVLWLGGKRIRVQVGIQSGSSSESGEEETLINENVD